MLSSPPHTHTTLACCLLPREEIVKPLASNNVEDMERNVQMLVDWIKANT